MARDQLTGCHGCSSYDVMNPEPNILYTVLFRLLATRMAMQLQHVIKLKLSSQLIGQFGHVTASASCKHPEKHGTPVLNHGIAR